MAASVPSMMVVLALHQLVPNIPRVTGCSLTAAVATTDQVKSAQQSQPRPLILKLLEELLDG
jgi:hypothetical protein